MPWTEELGEKLQEVFEQNPELIDEYQTGKYDLSTMDITTLGFTKD